MKKNISGFSSQRRRLGRPWLLLAATACATGGCASQVSRFEPGTVDKPHIETFAFTMANAFLIYGERAVLVDSGSNGSADDLVETLTKAGIRKGDLALIVLTHGHADHAGGAKRVHDQWGAPIAVGKDDVAMVEAGHNRELHPMFFFARLLRPFVDRPFTGFKPDIEVSGRLDLTPYGVAGVVNSAPGHTPGTLLVELPGGDAFVGDLMLGGYLGGAMMADKPDTHYFHDDQSAAERRICEVLDRGAKRLFLGHGGPITAEAARARFCATR